MAASCTRAAASLVLLVYICFNVGRVCGDGVDSCENLRLGQYPFYPKIDDATQEPDNCKDSVAWVECLPAPNISCRFSNGTEFTFSGEEVGFNKSVPCRNVNGYSYKVAVALSLFLGWLGADRFYLGYPALGLLKFCTVGFCGIGSLVDFMLISMQIVGPSDGSNYIVDYYGARLTRLSITNETYRRTQISP
ncbi:TM2 domain-containing protein 1 isoform X2 [Arapaima gigas]